MGSEDFKTQDICHQLCSNKKLIFLTESQDIYSQFCGSKSQIILKGSRDVATKPGSS